MSPPRATVRLQFHRGFAFRDAVALVPYFAALGISHLYSSPILTARAGSMHGYDVIDPTTVSSELGGEDALRRLVGELRAHAMGLIVDIVPNHMAVGSDNAWWVDVLAHGGDSRYAKFFDIDWRPPFPQIQGKVLLPVLGRPYGEALEAGEITLHRKAGQPPSIRYFDHTFPLAPHAADLCKDAPADAFDPASAAGRSRLHELLEAQHYRLAWWRSANDEINWRRFFDINELAAIRVEDDEVFEAIHATVLRLYAEGIIDGLRVDHIDGLSQPAAYCVKLRERLRVLEKDRPSGSPDGPTYLVVEKILAHGESLPKDWQVDGTTGYDFMNAVSALLHDERGERPLVALWLCVSGRSADFNDEEELARRQILQRSFSAQLEASVQVLYDIAQCDPKTRDFSWPALRRCLTEILAHFPVYRTYARPGEASQSDRDFLARAVARAEETCLPGDAWLVRILGDWLGGKGTRPETDRLQAVALARFQQLSAPLCAKAVEDTAFYRYGRLLSRNDVGFDARCFACAPADFHRKMQARASSFPHAMLATATHDHKRGEDVRARLAVLSEIANDWAQALEQWLRLSEPRRGPIPSAADLAILFQTVVGAWPLRLRLTDQTGLAEYAERIVAWQQKALREAKLRSDWSAPNEAYERAARDFIVGLFSEPSDLLTQIADFARRIAPAGAAKGLAQVLIKLTAPGVPDIYQGTEYWDLSLVDPDNRSPVGFAMRRKSLDATSPAALTSEWVDGRIKQAMIARVLAVRKKMPKLFSEGKYLPLHIDGSLAGHAIAFARILDNCAAVTLACHLPAQLLAGDGSLTIPSSRLQDSRIILPAEFQAFTLSDVLGQGEAFSNIREIDIGAVLTHLPVAFLASHSG